MNNLKALSEIKVLNHFVRAIDAFWPEYDNETAKQSCDKCEAKFFGDQRFHTFSMKQPVRFNALVGHYGNSGCHTFGSFDNGLIEKYLPQAMNKLSRALFAEMANIARNDAAKLTQDAEKELREYENAIETAKGTPA